MDVAIFGVVVAGFFVIALPIIVRKVSLPAVVDFEEVAEADLSDRQRIFLFEMDGKMADLGYRRARTFRPTNMQGDALVRAYLSAVDPAVFSVNMLRSSEEFGEKMSTSFLELTTEFEDGAVLNTRNAEVSDVFGALPEQVIQECRGVRDLAALKGIHERKASEMAVGSPLFRRPEELLDRFQEFHARWCAHQVARRRLHGVNTEGHHRVTVRTALQGIRNFLNPFADNFSPLRLAVAVIFGLFLPTAAVVWLGLPDNPLVAWVSALTGLDPGLAVSLCLLPVFTVAGLAVGLMFSTKAFIWSFLLCYLPMRLLGPVGWTPLVLSLWTSFVAGAVTRWVEKRRALL